MSVRRRLDRLNHLHDGNGPTAADALDDLNVTQAERDALPWNQVDKDSEVVLTEGMNEIHYDNGSLGREDDGTFAARCGCGWQTATVRKARHANDELLQHLLSNGVDEAVLRRRVPHLFPV